MIRYELPVESKVTMKIYNILGQVVIALVDEVQGAGYKSTEWNTTGISSGVYFYRLSARTISGGQDGLFTETKKLILLK